MQRTTLGVIATSVLVLGSYACGVDAPSAPASGGGTPLSYSARSRDGGDPLAQTVSSALDTVFVLRRVAPLRQNVSKSEEIGPEGGEIRIGEAGARIRFPAGAVAQPTVITMTADSGWNVAYEFAPHGIRFAQPVTIEQELGGTAAARFPELLRTLQGSYYDAPLDQSFVDPWQLFATVRENLPGRSDRRTMTFAFQIHHFSGYLVSSGRSGGGSQR